MMFHMAAPRVLSYGIEALRCFMPVSLGLKNGFIPRRIVSARLGTLSGWAERLGSLSLGLLDNLDLEIPHGP
jgi:hypothetical protein